MFRKTKPSKPCSNSFLLSYLKRQCDYEVIKTLIILMKKPHLWVLCLLSKSSSRAPALLNNVLLNANFLIALNVSAVKSSRANFVRVLCQMLEMLSTLTLQERLIHILTSTLSGCCLITKGLWCPMWLSGSSYVAECPTGITLGSKGPLVGVLHGKKFWTFLLCLEKEEESRLI